MNWWILVGGLVVFAFIVYLILPFLAFIGAIAYAVLAGVFGVIVS